ncbi:MAG: 2-C-methyl-D-erythritol 4-phosphate cytidylyltransferase [Elusimicrobia bacterium]|nr:2-C-methyl-D-erythritol 4-phosphate cytidylyltransferase [Elusimicrobiota bacterium]
MTNDKIQSSKLKISAIIVAAGVGNRMKASKPKQFLTIAGQPVLWYTLQRFIKTGIFREIVLVVGRNSFDYTQNAIIRKYKLQRVKLVAGGQERQDSVYQGLLSLQFCDYVVIHDGVRCLVAAQVIKDTIKAAQQYGAATAAVPLPDTIKESSARQLVKKTIDRSKLWRIQTPQVFRYEIIMKAFEKAYQTGFYGTDDAMLVEKLGKKVKLVMGNYDNLKITTPTDLLVAEQIIRRNPKSK